jgi:hypothetical protein
MSGYANINAFSDPNVLLQTLSGAQTANVQAQQIQNQYAPARNQLLLDEGAQQLGTNETNMMARAAQGLLDPSAYPDEASRAAAYPGVVADLQRNGFAKNAPTAYPGEATLRRVAGMGLSVPEQYQYGLVVPPGLAKALGGGQPPPGGGGATGGGGPDPVAAMPREQALDAIAQRESGNKNVPNAGGTSTASGYYQILDSTWQDGAKLVGLDVSRWPRAMDAPWMVQRQVAGALFDKYGAVPWAASAPGRVAPAATATGGPPSGAPGAARPELGTPGGGQPTPGMTDEQWLAQAGRSYPGLLGPNDTSQQPNAGAGTGTGVAARTGGTDVASNAPMAPQGSTGAAAATPSGTQVSAVRTPDGSIVTPTPPAPNGLRPSPPPPPAAAQAQPQQPATGVNSPQYQQWQRMQDEITRLIPYAALPAAKARIAQLQGQQQVLMQMDVKQPATRIGSNGEVIQGEVSTLTNEFKPYPFAPSPRAVEGEATWDGKQWTQTLPGQQGVPGRWSMGGGGPPQFYPTAARPAHGDYQAQLKLFDADLAEKNPLSDANQTASDLQIRLGQMRQLVGQISTGAGGTQRKDWANVADTLGLHDLAKQLIGAGGAEAAQIFEKYATQTAGELERATQGAKGSGIGALTLFKNANPGLDLQNAADVKMLNAQLIAAQGKRDYTQGALNHITRNSAAFSHGGDYSPKNDFDTQWTDQRNPQIYTAALRALDGDKWEDWTKGLNLKSEDDVHRVLDILRRADPTARVIWKDGQLLGVTDNSGG